MTRIYGVIFGQMNLVLENFYVRIFWSLKYTNFIQAKGFRFQYSFIVSANLKDSYSRDAEMHISRFIIEEIDDFDESTFRFITEHYAKPQIYRWISVGSNDKLRKRTKFLSTVRLICFASIESRVLTLHYTMINSINYSFKFLLLLWTIFGKVEFLWNFIIIKFRNFYRRCDPFA